MYAGLRSFRITQPEGFEHTKGVHYWAPFVLLPTSLYP